MKAEQITIDDAPDFTPAMLRAKASELEKRAKESTREVKSERLLNSFSKVITAAITMNFFVGVGLGVYATVWLGEPVGTTLDFIFWCVIVSILCYAGKTFGEKLVLDIVTALFMKREGGYKTNEQQPFG